MNFGMWILKNSHCFHCLLGAYWDLKFSRCFRELEDRYHIVLCRSTSTCCWLSNCWCDWDTQKIGSSLSYHNYFSARWFSFSWRDRCWSCWLCIAIFYIGIGYVHLVHGKFGVGMNNVVSSDIAFLVFYWFCYDYRSKEGDE